MAINLMLVYPISDDDWSMLQRLRMLALATAPTPVISAVTSTPIQQEPPFNETLSENEAALLDAMAMETHQNGTTDLTDLVWASSRRGRPNCQNSVATLATNFLNDNNGRAKRDDIIAHVWQKRQDMKLHSVKKNLYVWRTKKKLVISDDGYWSHPISN